MAMNEIEMKISCVCDDIKELLIHKNTDVLKGVHSARVLTPNSKFYLNYKTLNFELVSKRVHC